MVAWELGLRDEMLERLRRALERLDCAQAIVDAQRKRLLGNCGDEIWEQVGDAVRLLAKSWPQDYPANHPLPTTAARRPPSTARHDTNFPLRPARRLLQNAV